MNILWWAIAILVGGLTLSVIVGGIDAVVELRARKPPPAPRRTEVDEDEWKASSEDYGPEMGKWKRRAKILRRVRRRLQQQCGQASPETVVECFRQVVVRAKERGFVGEVADYETATEQLLPLLDGVLTLQEQRDTARAALRVAKTALASGHHLLLKYGDTQAHPWLAHYVKDMAAIDAALSAPESTTTPEVVYYASRWASETEDGGWGVACSRKVQGGRAGGIVKDAPDEATARRWAAEMNAAQAAAGYAHATRDDTLRVWWRSVQGPQAELTGPLIRFAGLVAAAAAAQRDSVIATLRAALLDTRLHVTRGNEIEAVKCIDAALSAPEGPEMSSADAVDRADALMARRMEDP